MKTAILLLLGSVVVVLATNDQFSEMEKRKSAYMRFGRSDPDLVNAAADDMDVQKRKSAYMRFGKRSDPELIDDESMDMEKRKSAFMRFGKRKSAYMRFGKRSFDDNDDEMSMEKRKSAYMR
ncbi:unnamed protein product [Auanema sp. JU1783]|nr:unnamed protein product [Auanema sp. JU1783]